MPYNFDSSKKKLEEEIKEDTQRQIQINIGSIDEEFTYLSDSFPFLSSLFITLVCYFLVFTFNQSGNWFVKIGLATYFAFPTICIMLQISVSDRVKYRLNNGELYVGRTKIMADDIKSVAITEYSPYYIKNDKFKIQAVNFSGYKEYLVEIIPRRLNTEHKLFFMSSINSADLLIKFLVHNEIHYGHMEKEPRKFMFYY